MSGRFLVTGGAGFIGSELVRQLSGPGATVIVADNLVNGRRENLEEVLGAGVRLEVVDIRDEAAMAHLLEGVEVVYHLACLGLRHSIHAPVENHEVNAGATLNLLRLADAAEVKRFVQVSSSEVYGTARWLPMTEDHPTYPTTVYGAAKLAGECYARAFHTTYGSHTVIVRPFNVFGPRSHHEGDSGEVIPKFMLRCLAGRPLVIFGDGMQSRDFTYVADAARGILLAGTVDGAAGKTINLGSGRMVTINELAAQVAAVAGCHDEAVERQAPRPGDIFQLCADWSKARELLGFEPQVDFIEGLAKLRDWYLGLGRSAEELLAEDVERNWGSNDVAAAAR